MMKTFYTARLLRRMKNLDSQWPWFIPFKPKNWGYLTFTKKIQNKWRNFICDILKQIVSCKELHRVYYIDPTQSTRHNTREEFDLWWGKSKTLCLEYWGKEKVIHNAIYGGIKPCLKV